MIREDTTIQPMEASPQEASYEAVEVTPTASAMLAQVMAEKGLGDHALRVFVSGGGCSGFQYGMAFEDEVEEGDVVFEVEGAPRIVVDPVSIQYLQGARIDFVESLMGGGFKIENPNAVASCGCGSSFRTSEDQAGSQQGQQGAAGCGSGCSH